VHSGEEEGDNARSSVDGVSRKKCGHFSLSFDRDTFAHIFYDIDLYPSYSSLSTNGPIRSTTNRQSTLAAWRFRSRSDLSNSQTKPPWEVGRVDS